MNEDKEDKSTVERKLDLRKQTGQIGEDAACAYLEEAGYRIIERNWRCKMGEIDLIVSRDDSPELLIFVEVRTRRAGGRFGTAAESVDRRKQQKVTTTVQYYLRMNNLSGNSVRFDVIAIQLERGDIIDELKHIEEAF
ncbi:MAG: YraN family protein [Candidatus Pristimantibacillus sp.]